MISLLNWFFEQGETVLNLPPNSCNGTAPDLGAFELPSLSIDGNFKRYSVNIRRGAHTFSILMRVIFQVVSISILYE